MAKYRVIKKSNGIFERFKPQKKVLNIFWVSVWLDGSVFPFAQYSNTLDIAKRSIINNKSKDKTKTTVIRID